MGARVPPLPHLIYAFGTCPDHVMGMGAFLWTNCRILRGEIRAAFKFMKKSPITAIPRPSTFIHMPWFSIWER